MQNSNDENEIIDDDVPLNSPAEEQAVQEEVVQAEVAQEEVAQEEVAQEEVAQEEVAQEETPEVLNDEEHMGEKPAQADLPEATQTIREVLTAQINNPQKETTVMADDSVSLGEILDKKYDEVVTVQPVKFATFNGDESVVGLPRKNLEIMQDVNIKITAELGRARMKVKKLLDVTKGSIIEINKIAGEQAELFVCGKLIAYGEVIVIEDKFGLKITSIIESQKNE